MAEAGGTSPALPWGGSSGLLRLLVISKIHNVEALYKSQYQLVHDSYKRQWKEIA